MIESLLRLELDPAEFVIYGSAPLLAHGLRDTITDLDIVARGSAWDRARAMADHRFELSLYGQPMIRFFDGRIEIYPQWIDETWSVDALVDTADIIGGLRFARLDQVLTYKRKMRRTKDIVDIAALERRLFGEHPSLVDKLPPPVLCGV